MAHGMERLRFMQGEWAVEAQTMTQEGDWIDISTPDETTIVQMIGGACHYEIMPVSQEGKIVRYLFSWSYDKYRGCYRMISCDDDSGVMGVMEGDFLPDSDTVVINDVNTGTAVLDESGRPAYFRQLASTKNHPDSFTDVISESYDAGTTWIDVFRASHTRK